MNNINLKDQFICSVLISELHFTYEMYPLFSVLVWSVTVANPPKLYPCIFPGPLCNSETFPGSDLLHYHIELATR